MTALALAPYVEWLTYDLEQDYTPFVLVTVGYPGERAEAWVSLRARDLVPPGEPLSESTTAGMIEHAATVGWAEAQLEEYLATVRGGAADRFLAFIENELAPAVAERYHVALDGAALWGYSYGGLFALYALFNQIGTFATIGASSPGVLTAENRIFELELEARESGVRPVSLYLTMNAVELTGRVWTYRDLAIQFARLVDLLHRDRIEGLTFSVDVLSDESHATGWTQAFLSFVRVRRLAPDLRGDAEEVAAEDRADVTLSVALVEQRDCQLRELQRADKPLRQVVRVPAAGREDVAVLFKVLVQLILIEDIVEAHANVLGADDADRVIDRSDERLGARVVIAEKDSDAVDPDHAAGLSARAHLIVADIPVVLLDAEGHRVRKDDRLRRSLEQVEHGLPRAVRRVDDDPKAVHLGDQLPPECGEPDLGVVVAAAARAVRPVVGDQAGAHAERVIGRKQGELTVERLGPLEVEGDREPPRQLRLVDVVDRGREDETLGPRQHAATERRCDLERVERRGEVEPDVDRDVVHSRLPVKPELADCVVVGAQGQAAVLVPDEGLRVQRGRVGDRGRSVAHARLRRRMELLVVCAGE
jgi:hypothetical protein